MRSLAWITGARSGPPKLALIDTEHESSAQPGPTVLTTPPGRLETATDVTYTLRNMHVLDALGNPVRRAILHRLRAGPLSVGEIADTLPVSRPAVSRHLRTLEEAGLVQAREDGTRNIYSIRIAGFATVRDYIDDFWDTALARLEELARK
jgi:DNA-binding transcriptional ArsR family regulator